MSHANSSNVSIDGLIQKIREEADKRQGVARQTPQSVLPADQRLRMSNIEALLNAALAKSQPRSELPAKFRRLGAFQTIALRIYRFLFKEQRAVNFSLIQAIRETLILNQSLLSQVSALQAEVDRLNAEISAQVHPQDSKPDQ